MVIFDALFGCHDILILGKIPTKCRQCPDMTIAVDWEVRHQSKQTKSNFKPIMGLSMENGSISANRKKTNRKLIHIGNFLDEIKAKSLTCSTLKDIFMLLEVFLCYIYCNFSEVF